MSSVHKWCRDQDGQDTVSCKESKFVTYLARESNEMIEEPEESEFTVEEEKFEKEINVEINKVEVCPVGWRKCETR